MKRTLIYLIVTMTLTAIAAAASDDSTTATRLPFLTRVLSYDPSPGQFVNEMPRCAAGEDYATVLQRAGAAICGSVSIEEIELPDGTLVRDTTVNYSNGMISLGGWGGSVTVGFDHPVVNVAGKPDFEIFGNAFVAEGTDAGGSSEPGIVLVSVDVNGNGIADDPWYELAGSAYNDTDTRHDYVMTYYKPADDKPVVKGANRSIIDMEHIHWTANDEDENNREGYYIQLRIHNHPYWPLWLPADSTVMTRTGSRLRKNYEQFGTMVIQRFFDYGYADNKPTLTVGSEGDDYNTGVYSEGFNIDWAVDDDGNHVFLPYIDFIKIYTAQNQYNSGMGETSTEVTGGMDLHVDAVNEWRTGDINGDTAVNVGDVNEILAMILNEHGVLATADLNRDGNINIGDVNAVLTIILNDE